MGAGTGNSHGSVGQTRQNNNHSRPAQAEAIWQPLRTAGVYLSASDERSDERQAPFVAADAPEGQSSAAWRLASISSTVSVGVWFEESIQSPSRDVSSRSTRSRSAGVNDP